MSRVHGNNFRALVATPRLRSDQLPSGDRDRDTRVTRDRDNHVRKTPRRSTGARITCRVAAGATSARRDAAIDARYTTSTMSARDGEARLPRPRARNRRQSIAPAEVTGGGRAGCGARQLSSSIVITVPASSRRRLARDSLTRGGQGKGDRERQRGRRAVGDTPFRSTPRAKEG